MLVRSSAGRQIPGVLFAEDFGDEDDDEAGRRASNGLPTTIEAKCEPSSVVVVGPTTEEIEEERLAARQEGFDAGLKAAQDAFTAQRADALHRLDNAFADALADMHGVVETSLSMLADTVVSILIECLPDLCERHGIGEMKAITRCLLPSLADEPQLVITVHPKLEDLLRREITSLKSKSERIKILSSETMLVGDITVKWVDGSASRDVGRWQTNMIEQLSGLNSSSVREKAT